MRQSIPPPKEGELPGELLEVADAVCVAGLAVVWGVVGVAAAISFSPSLSSYSFSPWARVTAPRPMLCTVKPNAISPTRTYWP